MRVFVTGVTGKSGRVFFQQCLKNKTVGSTFTFLIRNMDKAEELKTEWPEIDYVLGNLEDLPFVHNEMSKGLYDTVLHIAGIQFSLNLVKEAVRCKNIERLILVHTTGIYSKHKKAAECYKKIEAKIYEQLRGRDIALTILRPTMIYGSLDDGNVSTFMKMVFRLRIFPVVQHGNCELQPVWYGDLGKAYYQVLMNPMTTKDNEYNLSGGSPIRMIDMFRVMAKGLGVKNIFINVPFWFAYSGAWVVFCMSLGKIDYREHVQRLIEDRTFSHAKATADFGYKPLNFEDGINEELNDFLIRYRR